MIVLNSEDAVRAFSLGGNVTIGGGISATAGPIGTGGSVQASLAHPAPMFSYSKSKGAYSSFCYIPKVSSDYHTRFICRLVIGGHGAY